jgi:hypothetical protein
VEEGGGYQEEDTRLSIRGRGTSWIPTAWRKGGGGEHQDAIAPVPWRTRGYNCSDAVELDTDGGKEWMRVAVRSSEEQCSGGESQ